MKKILSICCFLACGFFAQAQCDIAISVDSSFVGLILTAETAGTQPDSYLWTTGETTQTIDVNPLFQEYCVTATFPDGCTATSCILLNGGWGDDCGVELEIVQGGTWLAANPTGEAPFSYVWNTGATDFSIPIAQTDTLLCVTITDATGCTATNCLDVNVDTSNVDCFMYILTEQLPAGGAALIAESGAGITTALWSTGETDFTIFPTSAGTYCVTVTDDSGDCELSDCIDFGLSCYNIIFNGDTSIIGQPQDYLTTYSSGVAPFTYQWSTGETTHNIYVDTNDTYCVTVTDALGCVSDNCFDFFVVQCEASISYTFDNEGIGNLCATATGVAPFTYAWSNGETSECFVPASSGTYSVVITDAEGCTANGAMNVILPSYEIFGWVYPVDSLNLTPDYQGRVYLIEMNPDGTASLIDSTDMVYEQWVMSYDFGSRPVGDYLVKAALTEGSAGYEENMPTYHLMSLTWTEADVITVPQSNYLQGSTIWMIEGDNPGGPGGIYGTVITGDGLDKPGGGVSTNGGGVESTGEPISNVSILLLDENENAVAFDYTNGSGEFEFPSLAWGTYKVQIEIAGMEEAHYWVTIGPDNSTIENLIFEVTEEGISTNINEIVQTETLTVFPNPVAQTINVVFNSTRNAEIELSLTDLTGRILKTDYQTVTLGQQILDLNVAELPTGVYFLNLANGKEVISQKIVKK